MKRRGVSWAAHGVVVLALTSCGGVAASSADSAGRSSGGRSAAGGTSDEARAGTGAGAASPVAGQGGSLAGAAGDASAQGGDSGVSDQGGSSGAPADHCLGELKFADPDVEAYVRTLIGKPTEPMYAADFSSVTDLSGLLNVFGSFDQRPCMLLLDCPAPEPPVSDQWVTSLGGLECMPHVQTIAVDAWYIADFSPLTALTQLAQLNLGLAPKLSRLPPLPQLRELSVFSSKGDLEGVAAMPNLTSLTGRFADLSAKDALAPLRSLKNLRTLVLARSHVTNVEALRGLHELTTIDLSSNEIADLSPLLDNPGLGPTTELYIADNPALYCNEPTVSALRARGVHVEPCVQ